MSCDYYFISATRNAAATGPDKCSWIPQEHRGPSQAVRMRLYRRPLAQWLAVLPIVTGAQLREWFAAEAAEWSSVYGQRYAESVARVADWADKEGGCYVQTEHDEPAERFWFTILWGDGWDVFDAWSA